MERQSSPNADRKWSDQISPDLLDRMERVDAELAPDRLTISEATGSRPEARNDFAAILDALPGQGLDALSDVVPPALSQGAEGGAKDRNLSDVVARIRDEGPADGEASADESAAAGGDAAGDGATEAEKAETEPVDPPAAPLPPARSRGSAGWRLAVIGLFGLSLLGGFLFQQQMERTAALRTELSALQEAVRVLHRDQERLRARLQQSEQAKEDWVNRQALEAALEAQARRLEADRQRVELLALAALGSTLQEKKSDREPPKAGEEASDGLDAARKRVQAQAAPAVRKSDATVAGKGAWAVNLLSSSSRAQAEKALRRLRAKEPRAVLRTARVKGKTVYRVAVVGFPTKQAALEYRDRKAAGLGARGAWVGRG